MINITTMLHGCKAVTVATLVSICLLSTVGCKKDLNPKWENHATAEFALRASEVRQTHTFIWEGTQSGNPSNDEQSIQELWITNWNETTLEAHSSELSFDGVNFSSSNPHAVLVEKLDARTCKLVYKSESKDPVTITATAGDISHKMIVYSTEVIMPEFVLVYLGGIEYKIPVWDEARWKKLSLKDKQLVDDKELFKEFGGVTRKPGDGAEFSVGKLVPENSSIRKMLSFSYFPQYTAGIKDVNQLTVEHGWPQFAKGGEERNIDFSEVIGRKAWIDIANFQPMDIKFDFTPKGATNTVKLYCFATFQWKSRL